jgi:hypothetical protein
MGQNLNKSRLDFEPGISGFGVGKPSHLARHAAEDNCLHGPDNRGKPEQSEEPAAQNRSGIRAGLIYTISLFATWKFYLPVAPVCENRQRMGMRFASQNSCGRFMPHCFGQALCEHPVEYPCRINEIFL